MKKVIITGATGFLGTKIASQLIKRGDQVTIFTRSVGKAEQIIPNAVEYVDWNLRSENWKLFLEGKDAIIHLAGENVMAKRWDKKQKENILASRINGTRAIINAIKDLKTKPKIFISASAVGYYGDSEELVNENSNAGNDFLSNVVKAWEEESSHVEKFDVRKVNVRIGIVLDKTEGALAKMITPFKFFVGGSLGSGKQWFPWVHIDDVIGIFLFALDNENVNGILNAVSPNPLRMEKFSKSLGKVLKRPAIFKVPAFFLRIIFGEGADVLLTGAQVIPQRTIELGYKFKYENLSEAIKNIVNS
jgi:uncharacterized protein